MSTIKKIAVKMDLNDNIAVVMQDVKKDDEVYIDNLKIISKQSIDRGHKIATTSIANNEYIIKYGVPIGKAKKDILIGQHVHEHNVADITNEINAK